MNRRRRHAAWIVAGLVLGPFLAAPAPAALGSDRASVSRDAGTLRGVAHASSLQRYEVHEFTTDSGVRVREFLGAGQVFAISWSGPVMPDLRTLLGVHFDRYAQFLAALPPGVHKSLRIVSADLVVESGGHLRAYVGRAYLTGALPAGTAASEVR